MLNISKSIYVAWDGIRKDNNLPEVAISPDGNTTNEKNKIHSMTSKYAHIAEHNNIPLPGFTLLETRGYYSPGWFIIDPRGFIVKITTENMQDILLTTGITEGLIQEQCIWARDNTETKLRLIPINSQSYKDAVINTTLFDEKIDKRLLKRGDKVLLQNELKGIYMGVFSLYGNIKYVSTGSKFGHLRIDKKLRKQIIKIEDNKFFYRTDANILKVIDPVRQELTKQEALSEIQRSIKSGNSIFSQYAGMFTGGYYFDEGIRAISLTGIKDPEISIKEITYADADRIIGNSIGPNEPNTLVFEDANGQMYMPYATHGYLKTLYTASCINTFIIDRLDITKRVDRINLAEEFRHFLTDEYRNKNKKPLSAFNKYYKIIRHIKDETYE